MSGAGRSVGVYCDLGRRQGAGHLVRGSALGAVLLALGAAVEVVADFEAVPWAADQVVELGLVPRQGRDPAALPGLARRRGWDTLVLDSYLAVPADLTGLAVPLAALDDEAPRVLPAALVVNQNLTAVGCDYSGWPARQVLRGPRYAMVRPRITAARPASPGVADGTGRPRRVLVVLGGTDAADAVHAVSRLVLSGPGPVELHVLCPGPAARAAVLALPVPPGSTVRAGPPVLDVERLMTWADLVVSAAGTSVWELCCLGVPMALVVVADNQLSNYRLLLDAGLAVGLGPVADVVAGRPAALPPLDPHVAREMASRAWHTVDGLGTERVARAVLGLRAGAAPATRRPPDPVHVPAAPTPAEESHA